MSVREVSNEVIGEVVNQTVMTSSLALLCLGGVVLYALQSKTLYHLVPSILESHTLWANHARSAVNICTQLRVFVSLLIVSFLARSC